MKPRLPEQKDDCDLQERLNACEMMRRELEMRQHALDQHAIFSVTDLNGVIRHANDKFCQLSGYSREELLGQNHRMLKSGAHDAALYEDMWSTISAGDVWSGEICNRAKDGTLYWVAATIVPSLGPDGMPYQYIGIRTDITSAKQVEQAQRALQAAELANQSKSEFLAVMSHEIRTPMNGVLGMVDLVLDSELQPAQREWLSMARTSAVQLLAILNDILDYSKIEAGHLAIDAEPFDLRALVGDLLEVMRVEARHKDLCLLSSLDASLPTALMGDAGRIRQVLLNLVGNAVKFTSHGVAEVSGWCESRSGEQIMLHLKVRDTGIGIAPEKQARIFEPFSQADASTTRNFGGTGLGLSICRRLVELMGGRIWVESEEGKGSEFHFTLNVTLANPAELERAAPNAPLPQPASVPVASLRVLLVEDYEPNQKLALAWLTKWGHQVDLVENGQEALDALAGKQPYDWVLMDLQMPVMDGLEATRQIRQREQAGLQPRTRIVAMTANAYTEDREACFAAGMDDYIAKPISPARLREVLRAA